MQTRSAARIAKRTGKLSSPTQTKELSPNNLSPNSKLFTPTVELSELASDLTKKQNSPISAKMVRTVELNSSRPAKMARNGLRLAEKPKQGSTRTKLAYPDEKPKSSTVHNNLATLSFISWRKSILMFGATMFCCLNMFFQEQILRLSPNSSNFISFVQHIFISLCGIFIIFILPSIQKGRNTKWSSIPFYYYFPLVLLSFVSIVSNNAALNFGVSIPLQMIFRSSSLIANMFLGMVILSHRYSTKKYLSVILITAGLILCSQEEYRLKRLKTEQPENVVDNYYWFDCSAGDSSIGTVANCLYTTVISLKPYEVFTSITANVGNQTIIGIGLMLVSLLLSAGIGIYQEFLSKSFGKFHNESLFYVHLFSLPIFCTLLPDLRRHLIEFSNSSSISLFSWIADFPKLPVIWIGHLWLYLAATVLTQYCCIWSVYRLTTECASLTVTLCVTNRKFISLLISIFYFGNLFTLVHWAGTALVFAGTLTFVFCDFISFSSLISLRLLILMPIKMIHTRLNFF